MLERRYRNDYVEDADAKVSARKETAYLYCGDYYVLDLPQSKRKKIQILNTGFAVWMFFLFLLAGIWNNEGSRTIYILIPYLFIFLPLIYMVLGTVSFCFCPVRMQFAQYDRSICRSRRSCIGACVIAGIAEVIDLIFLFCRWGTISVIREAGFAATLMGIILSGVGYGLFFNHYLSRVQIEKKTE